VRARLSGVCPNEDEAEEDGFPAAWEEERASDSRCTFAEGDRLAAGTGEEASLSSS
jgi:hypothetical protein